MTLVFPPEFPVEGVISTVPVLPTAGVVAAAGADAYPLIIIGTVDELISEPVDDELPPPDFDELELLLEDLSDELLLLDFFVDEELDELDDVEVLVVSVELELDELDELLDVEFSVYEATNIVGFSTIFSSVLLQVGGNTFHLSNL